MNNLASFIVFFDSVTFVNYLIVPCQSVMLFFFFEVLNESITWASGSSLVKGNVDAASFVVTLLFFMLGPLLPFFLGFIPNPLRQDRQKRCAGHYVRN
jgi:hypothetical protein